MIPFFVACIWICVCCLCLCLFFVSDLFIFFRFLQPIVKGGAKYINFFFSMRSYHRQQTQNLRLLRISLNISTYWSLVWKLTTVGLFPLFTWGSNPCFSCFALFFQTLLLLHSIATYTYLLTGYTVFINELFVPFLPQLVLLYIIYICLAPYWTISVVPTSFDILTYKPPSVELLLMLVSLQFSKVIGASLFFNVVSKGPQTTTKRFASSTL